MKVYVLVERFYCDTTVLDVYADQEVADAQAEALDEMAEQLGDSAYYDVYQREVQ